MPVGHVRAEVAGHHRPHAEASASSGPSMPAAVAALVPGVNRQAAVRSKYACMLVRVHSVPTRTMQLPAVLMWLQFNFSAVHNSGVQVCCRHPGWTESVAGVTSQSRQPFVAVIPCRSSQTVVSQPWQVLALENCEHQPR